MSVGKYAILFVVGFYLAACSGPNFVNAGAPAAANSLLSTPNSSSSTCSNSGGSVFKFTKILFLVDSSGSNANSAGVVGTDPSKNFRIGTIQKFLNTYASSANLQWGFMTFASSTVLDYIGNNGIGSFSNAKALQTALNSFSTEVDVGDTPYKAALAAAQAAITNDPDNNSVRAPEYFVVLLTDGFPSDLTSLLDVTTSVASMRASSKPGALLSTVYYGPQPDPGETSTDLNGHLGSAGVNMTNADALALLQYMAKGGAGEFANVHDPSTGLDLKDVIPITNCP